MDRRILHVDIDAFLASVEQLRDPALIGRPVAVGTGVVASRSYEAKARGVHTAMPLHEARRRCPELIVREGDARLCERYRQRVAEIVRRFAPVVEVCSLDDFYADLTGVPLRVEQELEDATATAGERSLQGLCRQLRAAVRAETGLSIAQGLGSSRTVARLATTKAKPGGICEVAPGGETTFLADFPVEAVPGIGPKTAAWLQQVGVTTVQQLWVVDRELLRQSFGARGDELWLRCRGLDDAPVRATPTLHSISRETSFEPRTDFGSQSTAFLRAMLAYLLDRASSELRAQRLLARTVQVRVRHTDGGLGERSRTLGEPTDRTDVCMVVAGELLDELLQRRVLVRLVGVTLASLQPPRAVQGSLFGDDGKARHQLFAAVDAVRARHGFGALVVGAAAGLLGQLPAGKHGFRLRTPSLTK
ncbi:MAG: DNA polymerase IV [Planctomycetes bacterium]|jgi:DNA polymerase-4|nr:DNA polymerase IV [Planctomycetota bacterium]